MRTIKGFTLIEMIIVMLITAIIMKTAALIMSKSFTSYFMGVNYTSLSSKGTLAMTRMSKELQQAISFSAISATSITFTTTTGHTITYSWSNPNLTRTDQQGLNTAQTLNNQVTSFNLYYYDSTLTSTAVLTSVQAVTINMTVNNSYGSVPLINTIYAVNAW